MTLPSSGAITFAQIATELGRTGTSVSLNQSDVAALAGKATSSSIILPNDFWGKSYGDFTPNAVNWANINTIDARFESSNAQQTISGISSSIVLRPVMSGLSSSGLMNSGYIRVWADLSFVDLWTYNGSVTNNTITVPNNTPVRFAIQLGTNSPNPVSLSCTITVLNQSDGDTSLDTFTITAESPGSSGGGGGV